MRISIYQPDIPQNLAALLRLSACLNVPLDIIEPCGFVFSDAKLRRSGMDYLELANIQRHISWESFLEKQTESRLVLVTTNANQTLEDFHFQLQDTLIFGRETSGVPQSVHESIPTQVRVPMHHHVRSLNVAICAGIVLWEALRQTDGLKASPVTD